MEKEVKAVPVTFSDATVLPPVPAETPKFKLFSKSQKKLFLALGIVATAVFGSFYVITSASEKNGSSVGAPLAQKIIKMAEPSPTPTPFEFQEMTVPYLRNQNFDAKFEKQEKKSENSIYSTHIASYRSDGFLVNGMLTIPEGKMPQGGWPTIIFLHGYIPPASYQTLVNYASYVDYFARRGFVVYKPDLRGHAQSEGEAGGGYYSADYVIDTLNSYSALQKLEVVNPNKIGLWGHSMAGNIVMRALVSRPEIPAAVIWAGAVYTYSDLAEFGISDNSYRPPAQNTERARKRTRLRELYGDFDANSEFWKQVVPTNYLNDFDASVQIHHAVDDNVVSVNFSRNLIGLLDSTKANAELVEYQNGGHNLVGGTFTQAMDKSVSFFKVNMNF